MCYNIFNKNYSTSLINKLYTYNTNNNTRLYFNINTLNVYTFLINVPLFTIVLFNNNLTNIFNHSYLFSIFFKFFQKNKLIFDFNKKSQKKIKKFYKNILYITKFNNNKTNLLTKKKIIQYNIHKDFKNYHKLFKKNSFNIFSPFVKIKKSRKFTFFQKKHLNKPLKFFKKDFKIRFKKRYWFFILISKLRKKIKIINYSNFLKNNYSKFLRLDKKSENKTNSLKKQKRNYLTPKQHLFLNIYKNKIKYVKSKPIKTFLLKKVLLFYKKKLYKTKYNQLTSKLTKKIFKYKLKSIVNNKKGRVFIIKTLKTTSQFFFSKKSFFLKKKFLKSRRKYILRKKQSLTMFRYFRLFISNKKWLNFMFYLKRSRVRFFAWRYRRLTMRNHKLIRFNRFLKQNKNTNVFNYNNILLKKSLLKKINQKTFLKFYRRRKWSNSFRLLINSSKKTNYTVKLLKKNNIEKPKKIKKMRRLRFKFKPIHYFLKNFIRRVKKNNVKKYRIVVKHFFRIFRSNFKLFIFKKPMQSDYDLLNKPLLMCEGLSNKFLNLKTKSNNINFFLKNNFIYKSIKIKKSILKLNNISKKILDKLKTTLNIEGFKSLTKFSFIKQVFTKNLIKYNLQGSNKLKLNLLLLKNSKKHFKTKFLKKFIFKPLDNIKTTFNTVSGKLPIISKYKTSFILSNLGFLFIQNINTVINNKIRSKINRYKFTFFYLNDIKRFFLKKPGFLKLTNSSLFSNNFNKFKNFNIKSFSSFSNNIFFSKNNLLLNTSNSENFIFKDRFFYNKNLNLYSKKEVRIKRIKFKPGYSRIWRNARKAINNSLNFNLKYQYRLTKELVRLSRVKNNAHIFIKELTLLNMLFNSHFVTDIKLSKLLINNNVVFVNGILSNNENLNLFKGDFIQIIVSLKYYIIYRWMLNWQKYKKTRLLKLAKVKFKKHNMMRDKQKSTRLPDWVLTSRIKSFDIPKYLEVDYFTLSTFVLYEPFLLNDFNPISLVDSRTEILNMYNWKYIN